MQGQGKNPVPILSHCVGPRQGIKLIFWGAQHTASSAVQVGLLTIYDMCKAVDRGMVMTNVRVLEKQGGKSGEWHAVIDD